MSSKHWADITGILDFGRLSSDRVRGGGASSVNNKGIDSSDQRNTDRHNLHFVAYICS